MKRYRKAVINIYGLISLLVIIGIIFIVGKSIDWNGKDLDPEASKATAFATYSNNSTPQKDEKIYNPYAGANFAAYQTRGEIFKGKNIETAEDTFTEVVPLKEEYTADSTKNFLENVNETDYLFAVSLESKENIGLHYTTLIKNKNVLAVVLSDENSFKLWDEVLSATMPQIPVKGLSENIIYIAEKKDEDVKNVVSQGYVFMIQNISDKKIKNVKTPEIKGVTIENNIIKIEVENYTRIEWITENGKIAGYGEEITPYAENISQWNTADINGGVSKPSKYLRAVIVGEESILYTQAFGLK